DPVRDRHRAAVLPAAAGPAPGSAAPVGQADALPVQGHRRVLVGGGRRDAAREPDLDLPDPAAGEPEDRRAGLFLERAGRPVRRRGTAGAAGGPVLMIRVAERVTGVGQARMGSGPGSPPSATVPSRAT